MFEATGVDVLFALARVLFGGIFVFLGVNHFLDTDSMTEYAAYKGLPAPKLAVLSSGVLLVFGGLSIVLGVLPMVGAGALALFLFVSAVTMHDFWNAEGETAQTELTSFLKNIYGGGGALAFVVLANTTWPYALNVGL
ncbi:DoxX family protein [Natronobiforma cellulositropha]|uniref:DoxX family protein n=1 Tax=Natronobiforma cellulositropha TaxID=1679076 RepID=UPI0021D5E9D0|nr:DoxX family protein [Natronobiforma cellulositropha]